MTPSIPQAVTSNPELSFLATLVDVTGMAETLGDTYPRFTLLAPSGAIPLVAPLAVQLRSKTK